MKLLPKHTQVNTTEPLGHGADAAFVVVLFFGFGFGLDKLVGTTPLFMILLTIVGAVGVFVRFWYRYDARMIEHERDRAAAASAAVSKREAR
jgi:F0F1-type ATP synthase assembly protein I